LWDAEFDDAVAGVEPAGGDCFGSGEEVHAFGAVGVGVAEQGGSVRDDPVIGNLDEISMCCHSVPSGEPSCLPAGIRHQPKRGRRQPYTQCVILRVNLRLSRRLARTTNVGCSRRGREPARCACAPADRRSLGRVRPATSRSGTAPHPAGGGPAIWPPRAFSIAAILVLADANDRCARSAPWVMLP
jgi:hypothetical protein